MADAELGIGTGGRGFEVRASLGPEDFGSGAMAGLLLDLEAYGCYGNVRRPLFIAGAAEIWRFQLLFVPCHSISKDEDSCIFRRGFLWQTSAREHSAEEERGSLWNGSNPVTYL